jgi:hypothetical protein
MLAPETAPVPPIVTVTLVELPGASGGIGIDAGVMVTLLVLGEKTRFETVEFEKFVMVSW